MRVCEANLSPNQRMQATMWVLAGWIVLLGTISSLAIAGGAHAQTYTPTAGESPLVLLRGPDDGVDYFMRLQLSQALVQASRWAEAEAILESLVAEFDRDPFVWMNLRRTRLELGKSLEAAEAARRAGELIGWDIAFPNGYWLFVAYMQAGDREAALRELRTMVFDRGGIWRQRVPEVFAPLGVITDELRADPEFREIVGLPDTSGWTREEGWAYDIDFLRGEVKRVNPDYRHRPLPTEFERRHQELKQNISRLSDEEIFFGMSRMLATLHQGHVFLWTGENVRTPNRLLPLHLYAFPEGIFIIDAQEPHRELIGSRVLRIGTLPAEEALRQVATGLSVDGDMGYVWAAHLLVQTYFLKGMGAISSTESVELSLQAHSGTTLGVTIATTTTRPERRLDSLVPPHGSAAPLFLSELAQAHWEQALPEHDAHFVQVNVMGHGSEERLDEFGDRLHRLLQETRPRNLIVDLRHNIGGTTQLYPSLLRTLVSFSREPGNQVYALIGRRTYSAAGNFVTDLERLANPVFVGEATSECCNLYGDPAAVRLPYSGLEGELTAVKWQLSQPADRRRELVPQVPVQLTAGAYFDGVDPALEAIFRLISRRAAEAAAGSPL
jgi:hypothetical protein